MKKLGLYFHIPFCNSKCYYCDFDSNTSSYKEQEKYIQALLKEIDLSEKTYNLKDNYIIDTVFIGGGTPTSLASNLLEALLEKINSSFNFSKNLEFTIEVNPNSLDDEKTKILSNSKINRISLGLQSANEKELKILGRTHSFKDFEKTYKNLRNYFENISVDLMINTPLQTKESFKETLEKVVSLNPEHISTYMLILYENTKLYKIIKDNNIVLDDDLSVFLYKYTEEFLKNKGFNRYEISNFSKEGKESKHNLKYWSLDEYLGFGRSAHSFFKNYRFENSKYQYEKLLFNEKLPIINRERESKTNLYEETIFLKLRTSEGINIKKLNKDFNLNFKEKYKKTLENLKNQGLINDYNENLSLTTDGILVSNKIFLEFM